MRTRRYPIGIQTFEEIRSEGYLYVDKSEYIYNLTHSDFKYSFLSRPRRFGKSLFASTLRAYFEGRKELFEGLAIEQLEKKWEPRPVIHLDMSGGKHMEKAMLERYILEIVQDNATRLGVTVDAVDLNVSMMQLVKRASEKYGKKVVLLIDEYDAPLLDVVHRGEELDQLRMVVRNFYSPIKLCDPFIHFAFLTGITKFSQLSIFSELNNLANISMTKEYEAVCGITQEELLGTMGSDIEELTKKLSVEYGRGLSPDDTLAMLKKQYDGYHFTWPSSDIYNPFSLMSAFAFGELKNYWFGSGTPTSLIEMLRKSQLSFESLNRMEASIDDFDVAPDHMITPLPLLYQSGYITIKERDIQTRLYTLDFPNDEVRTSMANSLLPNYVKPSGLSESRSMVARLAAMLNQGKIEDALVTLQRFMASVPYFDNAKSEGHFQAMVYVILTMLGIYADVEVRTHRGRLDMVARSAGHIYIFEFKIDKDAATALQQIQLKDYADRFAMEQLPVIRVGVNFDSDKGIITDWKIG